jgi:monoamine oxidase
MQYCMEFATAPGDAMAHTPLFRSLRRSLARAAADRAPTRRNLLRGTAGLVTAGLLGGSLAGCATPAPRRHSDGEPVAIIGAGLAGLTAAWELAKANVPFVVYEGSARIGGRVWTHENFNSAGQFVELGAELVDENHTELRNLCRELKVGVDKFTDPPPGVQNELFQYRGQLYSAHDFEEGLKPLLAVVGRARAEIQGRRNALAVSWDSPMNAARYDRMTLAAFLAAQTDVADWVREMVRIAYVGEMGREADEQSALNLVLLMDPESPGLYGESDEGSRIAGGSSSTVKALRTAIVARTGGSEEAVLRPRHELIALRHRGRALDLVFSQDETLRSVSASRVIIALPFSVLRHIDGVKDLALHPVKQRCIQECGYGSNTKIMSDFRGRPWREPGGRLPAFNGFLTTDAGPQTLWETSRDQGGANGIITDFLGGEAAVRVNATNQRAPVQFLARLDPRLGAAFTGRQRFMNWSQYRFSRGSYSCPLPGHYTTMFGIEGKPELGGQLLFAGEHTSVDSTGFMNGAVESGRRVAGEVLQPPAS